MIRRGFWYPQSPKKSDPRKSKELYWGLSFFYAGVENAKISSQCFFAGASALGSAREKLGQVGTNIGITSMETTIEYWGDNGKEDGSYYRILR